MSEFIVMQNRLVQCESDLAAAYDKIEWLTKEMAHIIAERDKTFALMLERAEKAEAQVAAAYEGAAYEADFYSYLAGDKIRALTSADTKAALEAYGREKVREGMKRAAEICDRNDQVSGWVSRDAILAEMEKLK